MVEDALRDALEENAREVTEDIINDLFEQRLSLLQSIIDEIHSEILKRKALRNGALQEIDEELSKFSSLLLQVAPEGRVSVSGKYVDSLNERRIHLEKSIARLTELRRTHKVSTWKDIVSLKHELFKLLPEYEKLRQLRKVVD